MQTNENHPNRKRIRNFFREKGVEKLIVTLGGNGSVAVNNDGVARVQSVKMPVVADTTAAGDSFVASFSTLWCAGLPARQALAFASHAAAITVSRPARTRASRRPRRSRRCSATEPPRSWR